MDGNTGVLLPDSPEGDRIMKRKWQLIIGLVLALVVTTGSYAFTALTTTATVNVAVAGEEIATTEASASQPGWNSILTPVGGAETLRPDGAGNYTQCDAVGDTANYLCADEAVADDDTTYVETVDGATEIDTYSIADHSAGSGTINSVTVHVRSRGTTTADLHAAETVIRTNGTDYFGTNTLLPLTYTDLSTAYTTNPFTSSAWTWTEVDALEAGVRHYDQGDGDVRTTQVYVEVSYGDIAQYGEVPTGDLFDITPNAQYSGDLAMKIYMTNTGDLVKAYDYLNMKVYIDGSVEAGETPDYQLLTLQNGEVDFNIQEFAPTLGSWTQTSQSEFEGGTLNQVDTTTSPGDVILDTFSDSVTDTFDDESKIASKVNLVVTAGQVKLTSAGGGGTETLRPDGAGDETLITDQFPLSGAHWDKVDEATSDDDSTYVSTEQGQFEEDLYNIANHSTGSGSINYVRVYIVGSAEVNPTTTNAYVHIKTNGVEYNGTEETTTTSYATYSYQWDVNPQTGSDWTWAEIDALQIGVGIRRPKNNRWTRVTQVYAEVNYTAYDSLGTLTAINLLSGETVVSIDSFGYNASAIPSGTSLKVQFSPDSTSWYNSAGTPDGWNTLSQGTHSIDLSGLGWSGANFYYKMEFTSDGTDTPVLDEISVTFSIYYASGDLTSSAYDTGYAVDWGTISFTIVEPSLTDIKFQIRTAATQAGLSSATWYGPTGPGDYYTTGGTNINSVHDGDRWIQYKAYFSGPQDSTPTLSDVTITYTATAAIFTVEVIGGAYSLISTDTSEWQSGWTVTPEFYCQVVQR